MMLLVAGVALGLWLVAEEVRKGAFEGDDELLGPKQLERGRHSGHSSFSSVAFRSSDPRSC